MTGLLTRNPDQTLETTGNLEIFDGARPDDPVGQGSWDLNSQNPQSLSADKAGTISKLNLFTLELPWKDNAPDVSCIPTGTYQVQKINTPELGNHFAVLNIPGRSLIRIHAANYIRELLGCIAVGLEGGTLVIPGGDGLIDAENSKAALEQLWKVTPDTWTLTVSNLTPAIS